MRRLFDDREEQLDLLVGVFSSALMGSLGILAAVWLLFSVIVGSSVMVSQIVDWFS